MTRKERERRAYELLRAARKAAAVLRAQCRPRARCPPLVIPPDETKPADPAEYQCALRDELPPGTPKGEACTLIHPNVRGAKNQADQAHAAFEGAGLTP
ncbi:hypothetical protein [Streptomyces sp. NRRL B-3648]|uniref:hypothetical protein n=1 Tax=Streptomyces sp. NRRL B-3648 TaxID=1519493 RepID=UPI0006AE9EAD|nr:hypothetical protein [Streptomyces sp. NRRL B-3648]KOV97294.1 hypothetical protein ADL04_15770 [Streptomyces sp. NRRL B-3648]